jgi:hypothetical protein
VASKNGRRYMPFKFLVYLEISIFGSISKKVYETPPIYTVIQNFDIAPLY